MLRILLSCLVLGVERKRCQDPFPETSPARIPGGRCSADRLKRWLTVLVRCSWRRCVWRMGADGRCSADRLKRWLTVLVGCSWRRCAWRMGADGRCLADRLKRWLTVLVGCSWRRCAWRIGDDGRCSTDRLKRWLTVRCSWRRCAWRMGADGRCSADRLKCYSYRIRRGSRPNDTLAAQLVISRNECYGEANLGLTFIPRDQEPLTPSAR